MSDSVVASDTTEAEALPYLARKPRIEKARASMACVTSAYYSGYKRCSSSNAPAPILFEIC